MTLSWTSVAGITFAILAVMPATAQAQDQAIPRLTPATMKRVGQVDERYQSYNVEMLEVTGGRFWKPYKDINTPAKSASNNAAPAQGNDSPAGMNPDLYQYRPPIDLANPRLRAMARALAPAYVRISGTWANTTYFDESNSPPKLPPKGYDGVLTKQQCLVRLPSPRPSMRQS